MYERAAGRVIVPARGPDGASESVAEEAQEERMAQVSAVEVPGRHIEG